MSAVTLGEYRDPYTDGVGSFGREQLAWTRGQLSRLDGLRDLMVRRRKWHKRTGQGLFAANASLRESVDRLAVRGLIPLAGLVDVGLSLDASDDDISQYCETKSRECERIISRHDGAFPGLRVLVLLEAVGIDPASLFSRRNKAGEIVEKSWQARVCCPMWWRRKLRPVCARGAESVCRDAGYTSRHSGAYVSDFTFSRWQSGQRRGRSIVESMDIVDEDSGEVFALSDAVDASVSNPEIRRGELMTRARGFEESAEMLGYIPMFYTITCPSRFHAWSGSRRNNKFDGSSPREAAAYLSRLWAGARARLARQKIAYFGFRVAEPHHDGCPHWHLLLFVEPVQKYALTEILHGHALADSGDELGADKHRFEAVEISPDSGGPGGATGYIAKYIAKNIDGHRVGDDLESLSPADVSALRVRAWASTWGIRQFQQVGGPSVTVWRELRRAALEPERQSAGPYLQQIIDACDAGDWCGFVELMGGPVAARADRPVSLLYSELVGLRRRLGRYGEAVRRVVGVFGGPVVGVAISRWRSWVSKRRDSVASFMSAGYGVGSFGMTGGDVGILSPPTGRALDLCQ